MGKSIRLRANSLLCACAVVIAAVQLGGAPTALGQCDAPYPRLVFEGSASFDVSDLIPDTSALIPLNDWQPLFLFTLSGDETFRNLAGLGFFLKNDPKAAERAYSIGAELQESDILEFAIFKEGGPEDEWGSLNDQDSLVVGRAGTTLAGIPCRFNAQGQLIQSPSTNIDTDPGELIYDLDLINFDITNIGGEQGQNYIVAFRTSATWRNSLSVAYEWYCALMVTDFLGGWIVPTNAEGELLDTYPDENVNPETAYSSSFGAWDITSGPSTSTGAPVFQNAWAHPRFMYTPLAEYIRPRFDVGGATFDFVTGEFLELRKLVPLDNWREVIAIDLHGGAVSNLPPQFPANEGAGTTDPILKEVNVILTDIGADPNGPPGNGGFNPTNGLETFTRASRFDADGDHVDTADGRDFAYNGAWVYYDTNNDGQFTPPAPQGGTGGVTFTDHPMVPEGYFDDFGNLPENPDDINPGLARWEYVPFPPGGGDPWWKIRLRLSNWGRRRAETDANTGWLTATPDPFGAAFSSFYPEYFVVVRPDSGYQDSSALPGDGVGLTYGADFRAFIEPRRFNPNSGHEDGGIFVATQIPRDSFIEEGIYSGSAWQDDALWVQEDDVTPEPFWPERTLNKTNAKPVRTTVEIHDLVINYETNNLYAKVTFLEYGVGLGRGLGTAWPIFSRWLDPLGLTASQFQDFQSVGVVAWSTQIAGSDEHIFRTFQYPYETVPFFQPDNDLPPFGPRSAFLPVPPGQPELPDFDEWPATLGPDEFPRESQFALADRRGRYLKQHIESNGRPTAMIGINICGADDPIVNQFSPIQLQQLTVAFWGPDFDPTEDLLALDSNGTSTSSGVILVEDGVPDTESTDIPQPYLGRNGVFGAQFGVSTELSTDTAVPLSNLGWRTQPELIDATGDGVADDMDGDGVVNDNDKAWVLRMRPKAPWRLPARDEEGGFFPGATAKSGAADEGAEITEAVADGNAVHTPEKRDASGDDAQNADEPAVAVSKSGTGYFAKTPVQMTEQEAIDLALAAPAGGKNGAKAAGPAGNAGDDLFVVVRTSNKMKRFEQFRCVVPSSLPERSTNEKPAGVQLLPQTPISLAVYDKSQPEEGVFPYYGPEPFGFDMIEANVAGEIVDLTGTGQTITPDSGAVAVLGLDLSTNRGAAGIAAQGATGTGDKASFTAQGVNWTPNAFVGYFLIDSSYTPWRILSHNNKKLTLDALSNAAGTPKSGAWIIAKDPTFLEQVIVELYDKGNDGAFNFLDDLKPMDIDPDVSGLAIYRDNDNNPSNENGIFDDGDVPVQLDYAPFQIGQAGEVATQLMMVFSTPGTDGVPSSTASQTRHRQWVADSFGSGQVDPNQGPDFFIVIRTSEDITLGDDFGVGIASWGPNTPTEPDPDTFPPPPATRSGEFDVFSEFPWGQRAVGLITFFQDEPYYKQYPEEDNSGFNWVRHTINKQTQTRTILTVDEVTQPDDLLITDVSPKTLPKNVTGDGVTLLITGQNFGSDPDVTLDSIVLTVLASTDSSITAIIPGGNTLDTDGDGKVSLKVTDPATSDFDRFSNFTVTGGSGGGTAPKITSINPTSGTKNDFPVTITGTNFENPVVTFQGVKMPIQGTPTSTTIVVAFPAGGMPTGALDVQVKNSDSGLLAVKPDGFTYINSPGGGGGGGGGGFGGGGGLPSVGGCFIATAAYGSPLGGHLDTFRAFRDDVLLKTAPGTALVEAYYTVSPAIADRVAQYPVLAAVVRATLTPVAWALESPVLAGVLALTIVGGAVAMRARKKRACASAVPR